MTIPISILVHDLGPTQLSYMCTKTLNNLYDMPFTVYTEILSPTCLPPKFPILHISEAWAQPGIAIATSLSTANKMLKFPRASHKLLYVWDLWWLRGRQRIYNNFASIFLNKELKLIARSTTHAQLIVNCFNRKPEFVFDNFDKEQLQLCLKPLMNICMKNT